jgi:hypothetical protein
VDRAGARAGRSVLAVEPDRRQRIEHRGHRSRAIGRGWYQDGTDGSLKINSDVYADVNVAVYGFSKPSDDPCLGVLSSKLYARDLTTGNSLLIGSSGSIVANVDIVGGIAGVALIQADSTSSSATPPVLVQVTTMNGQVESVPVSLGGAVTQSTA